MPTERDLQRIWYGGARPGFGLRVASLLFGAVSATRRWLYANGWLASVRLPVPVVVVGNLTVGGTGKTPLVIALVDALRRRGWKPGVVTRGFAGSAKTVTRVDASADPRVVGDEARLIFDRTHAPVSVGRDRVAAARALLAGGDVDVIVTDDGLQHYRLRRDVEIAVIDGQRRFGNGRLLPAGPLREPVGRLRTVDFRVCNGDAAAPEEIAMRLSGSDVFSLDESSRQPLAAFAGRRVHAVAGIGNPDRFFAQLRAVGLEPVEHPFPDHHAFAPNDVRFDDDLPVLMTEKDAVKCRAFAAPNRWYLPVRAQLPEAFFDALDRRLRATEA